MPILNSLGGASSRSFGGVGGGGIPAPENTVAPVVSGSETQGSTLSVTTGTWENADSFAYQWVNNTDGDISGATSSTYVLQSSDLGDTIKCRVTATGPGGETSADSNTTGTIGAAPGSQLYTTGGTYTWPVPSGVTSFSVVMIGGGAGAGGFGQAFGGGGAALVHVNDFPSSPGQSYAVTVGGGGIGGSNEQRGNDGGSSSLIGNTPGLLYAKANGGRVQASSSGTVNTVGFFQPVSNGTINNSLSGANPFAGGSGAAGYSGSGGQGGRPGQNANPGLGGGGGGAHGSTSVYGGGGGGTGIYGQGTSGNASNSGGQGGGGGSGGNAGAPGPSINAGIEGGTGGQYGGTAGPAQDRSGDTGGQGGGGAVRIVWPGANRQYPSTFVGLGDVP